MCKFDEFEDVKSFASAIRWRDDRSYAIPEIFKFSSRIPVATIPESKGNPNSRNPNEVRDYSSAPRKRAGTAHRENLQTNA